MTIGDGGWASTLLLFTYWNVKIWTKTLKTAWQVRLQPHLTVCVILTLTAGREPSPCSLHLTHMWVWQCSALLYTHIKYYVIIMKEESTPYFFLLLLWGRGWLKKKISKGTKKQNKKARHHCSRKFIWPVPAAFGRAYRWRLYPTSQATTLPLGLLEEIHEDDTQQNLGEATQVQFLQHVYPKAHRDFCGISWQRARCTRTCLYPRTGR